MQIHELTKLKEAGVMDYAKALFKPAPGTQGMTMSQRASAAAGNATAKQLGASLGNQWAKRAAIAQAAQASGQPEDKKYVEDSLRDMIDRTAFRGRMSQVSPAVKPQLDAAITAIMNAGLDPAANKKSWENLGVIASSALIQKNPSVQKSVQQPAQAAATPAAAPATGQPTTAPAPAPATAAPDAAQIIANLEKTVPKDVLMAVASELIKKYTSRATPK